MSTITPQMTQIIVTSDWQSEYNKIRLKQVECYSATEIIKTAIASWCSTAVSRSKAALKRALEVCSCTWHGRYQVTTYTESKDAFVIRRVGDALSGDSIPCFVRRTHRITKTYDRMKQQVCRSQRELISDEMVQPPR